MAKAKAAGSASGTAKASLFGGAKKGNPKKAIPKNVQQSLRYVECYENGIIQVEPGVFSKMFRFDDFSFKTKSQEEQEEIFESYCKFLNSLTPDENVFITIANVPGDKKASVEAIIPQKRGDKYDEYRDEIGNMIRDKISTLRNNIVTKKYITVTIKDDDVAKVSRRFAEIYGEIDSAFKKITRESIYEVKLAERLELLALLYRGEDTSLYFQHDLDGNVSVDWSDMKAHGLTTKDIICPECIKTKVNYMQLSENRFAQSMYLDKIANWLNTNFFADICEANIESVVTVHIEPIPQETAIKMVHNQSVNITAEVMEKQKNLLKSGYSPDMIPMDLADSKEQIDDLQNDLQNRDQKLFFVAMSLAHFSGSEEEYRQNSKMMKSLAAKHMCSLQPCTWMQERGLNSSLPYGIDDLYTKKILTTEALGTLIPFDEANTTDKGGLYYGVNAINKSVIVYDRKQGQNYNGLILGSSGSGKSFSAKREMSSVFLQGNADIYIIDPDGEYTPLAETFDGEVVHIAPGSSDFINPFDLDVDASFDQDLNPLAMKMDFICGMIESMIGGFVRLTPTQRSIIDRCVRQMYVPYMEHLQTLPPKDGRPVTIDKASCPTMQALFELLLSQPQAEAQNLALAMESYAVGMFDTFAHKTTVDLTKRVVVYDIKNIGTNLRELALKVCLNDIWNKMMENRRIGKWTYFYVDEFHLLLSNPSTSEFLKSVWKRARKWQGVPTGITQNVEDLLASADARAIINNSSFIYMLNQSAMDRLALQELLKLSDNDLEFITNVERGRGLIKTSKAVIPFMDDFPSNTKLFQIMTTKPKSAEEEAAEAAAKAAKGL